MRGGRGASSSPVSQEQRRMPLRKHFIQDDTCDFPSGSQQTEEDVQEDEALDDRDNVKKDELSPSTQTRRRERDNKSKPKEMTEEEMMDLALRLSEQEASIAALKLQKEEEAVMKAIQESMVSQTPHSPAAEASPRKLSHSNRKPASEASGDVCAPETDLNPGTEERANRNKRKRKAGSPLLEMPDLSQTQDLFSQASPCSSESLCVAPDSPQSSDSTQITDCPKSPVFPSSGCRAEVHVPRLSQDLLQTCRTSGFVLCSQDSLTWSAPPRSPTFPKSPVFSETDQGDEGEAEPSPEYFKSPVFGRNTQHESSPSACRPAASVCNSGFMFSSQESLTSSVRTASCRPTSPVFPRSAAPPEHLPPPQTQTGGGLGEQSRGRSASHIQKLPASPSAAAELTGSSAGSRGRDSSTDPSPDVGVHKSQSVDEEELKETSAEMQPAGDVTLLWSDEDEDVTPGGSPSPVFPEERPDVRAASLNHVLASPGTDGSGCRPSSSSSSSSSDGRQQLSTAEREPRPISSQDTAGGAEPAGGPTVHYYWGVPFCPRGLDPDTYTQVILAQMEVYEKSLKRAQRSLLRKAEWGGGVLPEPETSPPPPESPAASPQQLVPRRRGLRLRGKILREASDPIAAEEEEEEDKRDGEEEEEEEKREEEGGGRGGQVDVDCEVCPETQLSPEDEDWTQDLMKAAEVRPEVEMILPDDSPQEVEQEVQVDAPVDGKTNGTNIKDVGGQNARKQEEREGRDPDVEAIKDGGLRRSTSPEPEPAAVPRSPETNVDCPICQGSFPATQIELHAAYCDGEVAVVDERRPEDDCFQVSLKPRRKRARRAEEDANDASTSGENQEKCFVCQKDVPLRDFSRHTELCIQRRPSKAAAKGNLLSALEQTERRDSKARPSGSKLQPGDVIDLRDDDDEDDEEEDGGGVSALRISNSPIRSFTPISEASGCLVDFKKQPRVKKLSRR